MAIVGCGALGSALGDMMVRAGVGRVRLIDRDYVEPSNLQRQSLFEESDAAAGLPKALVRQFFDPATARLLPAEKQCSTGLAFHKAIEALPDDRADMFYFAMMDSA